MRDASRLRQLDVSQVGGDVRVTAFLPQTWRSRAGLPDE